MKDFSLEKFRACAYRQIALSRAIAAADCAAPRLRKILRAREPSRASRSLRERCSAAAQNPEAQERLRCCPKGGGSGKLAAGSRGYERLSATTIGHRTRDARGPAAQRNPRSGGRSSMHKSSKPRIFRSEILKRMPLQKSWPKGFFAREISRLTHLES